jgi:acyl-CoA synthetase (AMP-forming)/AMP-acid ligase II
MAQTYGQVEAPNICTFLSPREHAEAMESDRRRLASCGRASALTQVEIVDDVGCVVAPEKHGEIVVRGNLVMHGYLDEKAGAIRLHDRNKWHHTGDIGVKDRDGYVYIVDRQRDMIISGGFNVYPSEVEQVIWSHGDVTDCAVIGIPHPKWGEAVHAVVELRGGAKLDPDALIAYCRARLGGIKTPKSVEFVKALPRSAVGKVLKKDLRDRYWSQQERRI